MIVISGQKSRVPSAVYDKYSQCGSQVVSTAHGGALSISLGPAKIFWENWLEIRNFGDEKFRGRRLHELNATFKD